MPVRLRPMGSFTPTDILESTVKEQDKDKTHGWTISRPIPYFTWQGRLKMALDVLTCKADALYWDK